MRSPGTRSRSVRSRTAQRRFSLERRTIPPSLNCSARSSPNCRFHVVNLAIAIDPARIAVGGGLVRSWPVIEAGLRRALRAAVPYPPELVIARFPHDAPLIGALTLGITAARARLTREAPAWAD